MRHLNPSMFPKVNSRTSPGLLTKRTSADPTFDLTFFFHGEKKLVTNTVRENAPLEMLMSSI